MSPLGPLPKPTILISLTVSMLFGPAPSMPILVSAGYFRLTESRTLCLVSAFFS